jgi:hypothetical protein
MDVVWMQLLDVHFTFWPVTPSLLLRSGPNIEIAITQEHIK